MPDGDPPSISRVREGSCRVALKGTRARGCPSRTGPLEEIPHPRRLCLYSPATVSTRARRGMDVGMAPTRLIAAMMAKIWWNASMKAPTSSCPWGTGSPAKIACMTGNGIRDAMIANARPRLTRNPTLKSVDDMPAATPRRTTGTEFMIEATFGAMNRPPPMPARIIGKTRIEYEAPYGSVANQTYDAAEMRRPAVVKPRGPYLSER